MSLSQSLRPPKRKRFTSLGGEKSLLGPVGGDTFDDGVLVGNFKTGQWKKLSEPKAPASLALKRYVMPMQRVGENDQGRTR